MGNGKSKQELQEAQEQHRKNVEDDRRKQVEAGEQLKREHDAAQLKKVQAEKEKNEKEVAEAARRNLAELDAEIAKLEGLKDRHDMEMMQWKTEARERSVKENAQLEAAARAEQEKRKKEYEAEAVKLEKRKNDLASERSKLLVTIEEGKKSRTEMQQAHNQKTEKQTKEHNEYILTANKNLHEYRMVKGNEMKAMVEAARIEQKALTDRNERLQTNEMQGAVTLVKAQESEKQHDDFRLRCNQLRIHFKCFNDGYNNQTRNLTKTVLEMRRKNKLTSLPQALIVYDTLTGFTTIVNQFTIPDRFKATFDTSLAEIQSLTNALGNSLMIIDDSIVAYQKALEKTGEVDDKEYETAKKEFDAIKKSVADLIKLVKTFDIPVTNEILEEVNRQSAALHADTQRYLENGSSGGLKKLGQ